MLDIKALEDEIAQEEAAAKEKALSPEEQRIAAALARRAKIREDVAAAAKTRRSFDLAAREKAARAKAPKGVLVKGVDLIDFIPLGECTPEVEASFPTGGVIVVRSAESLGEFLRELEHKKRDSWEIFLDLLCANTVDPSPDNEIEMAKLRVAGERFNGVALNGGDVVAVLGGMKSRVDKRGRG